MADWAKSTAMNNPVFSIKNSWGSVKDLTSNTLIYSSCYWVRGLKILAALIGSIFNHYRDGLPHRNIWSNVIFQEIKDLRIYYHSSWINISSPSSTGWLPIRRKIRGFTCVRDAYYGMASSINGSKLLTMFRLYHDGTYQPDSFYAMRTTQTRSFSKLVSWVLEHKYCTDYNRCLILKYLIKIVSTCHIAAHVAEWFYFYGNSVFISHNTIYCIDKSIMHWQSV